jgi:hypothetical protein
MNEELKKTALALYKPPFRYSHGFIWDADNRMVADHPAEGAALRIRGWGYIQYKPEPEQLQDAMGELIAQAMTEMWGREPIPTILHCPRCHARHVDAPEPENGWTNPPHKSHLCRNCGIVWRPANVPTYGVARIESRGERDTWPPCGECGGTGAVEYALPGFSCDLEQSTEMATCDKCGGSGLPQTSES